MWLKGNLKSHTKTDVAILLTKDFGLVLARRASDHKKLLARAQNLSVLDDLTGFFFIPEKGKKMLLTSPLSLQKT